MRKLFFILMTLVTAVSYASDIVCVGAAKQVVRGRDTVYVFRDEVALRSTCGDVEWFNVAGQCIASGVDEIYPDDGVYRIRKSNGQMSRPFRARKYSDLEQLAFTVETSCDNTILHVTGLDTCARTYSLSYTRLAWDSINNNWTDQSVTKTGDLAATIILYEPLYAPTVMRLCYDAEVRSEMGLDSACVETEVAEADIMAVNMHLTSLFSARNDSNEMERPTDATIIDAGSTATISGPFEVGFYSNPTPAVLFYTWEVYKATDLLVTRNDRDLRYTFVEPGSYRVKCTVNNNECTSETAEVQVNISESYLRVPNVFTPDGNGQNDEFRVAFRSIKKFHCEIYNRWGKKVYEWNDPGKGWDGTIYGKPAAEGAYYYVIRALGTDAGTGAKDARGHKIGVYHLSGDINLIRRKK